jgi:hypothetical protein
MPIFITCQATNFQSSQYYISLYVIVLNSVYFTVTADFHLWGREMQYAEKIKTDYY